MKFFLLFFISFSLQAADSADTIAQKAACAANTANKWSERLNRCMTSQDAIATRNEAEACSKETDIEKKKACHMALANKSTSEKGVTKDSAKAGANKVSDNQSRSAMVNGAAGVISAINMFAAGSIKDPCMCKNIFAATAVVGLVTDITQKKSATKKFSELQNKYQINAKSTTFDAQKKALEYLRDEQKTVADIAKSEENRQMLLEIGYGIAAGMAIFEFKDPLCYPPTSSTAPAPTATPAAGGASMLSSIGTFFGTPAGIIVLAGIGTLNADTLRSEAAKQKEESEANATKIEAILKTFADSMVNQCPNGREKLEEPECYCNLADGTHNPNRTNSQICQQLWAANNYKTLATADDYSQKDGKNNPTGCVSIDGKFDQACQCKKLIDPSGNNACAKTANTFSGVSNPLGMGYLKNSGFSHLGSALDSAGNGTLNLASLNGKGLANALAKQNALNSQLFKNVKNDPDKKDFPIGLSNADLLKAQNSIFSKDDMAKFASSGGSALTASDSNPPSEGLSNAINDAKKSSGLEMSGGQGLGKKVAKASFNMDFGGPSASGGAVTQNFMDKNYNYKQDDIVKKPDSSIFDVISNRYIESGLKRLFDDK